jgi:hypothetical protein
VEGVRRALFIAACAALLSAFAAGARPRIKETRRAKAQQAPALDPSRWFATRIGLIRVYQEKSARPADEDGEPPTAAGASCEVVESHPEDDASVGKTREVCTMIVGRKRKLATALTYELRRSGIFQVRAEMGGKAQDAERLLLPGPVRVGARWTESRGATTLERHIKSAGEGCKAAGRTFGDCLVITVQQKRGKAVEARYTETYAAGVGLVESAQWELVDLSGL